MRRSVILWIILVLVAFVCTVLSGGADADPVEDPVGTNMTLSVPGPQGSHYLWTLPGDNVTVSIWNYSGSENRLATVDFTFAFYDLYFERSPNLDADLHAGLQLRTGENYTFWAIAFEPNLMTINLWMFNDYIDASYKYRIDRTTSSYTPDYLGGGGEDVRADLDSLTNSTSALSEETASLRENTTNIWDNISIVIADIEEMDLHLRDLGILLWAFSDLQNATAADVAGLAEVLGELNATLTSLTADVEALKATGVDLAWVEQNITDIRSQLADVVRDLGGISQLELDLLELENSLSQAVSDIEILNESLTTVEESIPVPYDDSALLERIAQLEGQNQLLQQQIDDLEDEQNEMRDSTPSSAIGYIALVLAVMGIAIALAVYMMIKVGEDRLWKEEK